MFKLFFLENKTWQVTCEEWSKTYMLFLSQHNLAQFNNIIQKHTFISIHSFGPSRKQDGSKLNTLVLSTFLTSKLIWKRISR